MQFTRFQIESVLSRVVVIKGRREGQTLGPSTVNQYTKSFMKVYHQISDDIFVAEPLEEYLDQECPNPKTRRTVIIATNHIVKRAAVFSEDTKQDMQELCTRICWTCNSADRNAAAWGVKMPLLVKYRGIPYKALLLSLAAGAEQDRTESSLSVSKQPLHSL